MTIMIVVVWRMSVAETVLKEDRRSTVGTAAGRGRGREGEEGGHTETEMSEVAATIETETGTIFKMVV